MEKVNNNYNIDDESENNSDNDSSYFDYLRWYQHV